MKFSSGFSGGMMKTNDLLMNSLPLCRQPGLLNAIDDFVLSLERHGRLDLVQRFSEWKNKRNAYPFGQLLAKKMSEDEVRRYCCFERLAWAAKETENLARDRIRVIKQKYVALSVANAEQGSQDEFTVTKMRDEISKAQAQVEVKTSTDWRQALAANIIER